MQHKRAQLKVRLYSTNSTTPLQPHNRQHHFFATSLSHGKPPPQFMPSHPLAPPISWQTPAPVDSKSATWPLPSHGLHSPPFRPPSPMS